MAAFIQHVSIRSMSAKTPKAGTLRSNRRTSVHIHMLEADSKDIMG